MGETELQITQPAQEMLSDMHQRLIEVGVAYGPASIEYIDVLESLTWALLSLLRLGGRITADGELSLFGNSWIAYGVIFRPKRISLTERDPLLGEWEVHS